MIASQHWAKKVDVIIGQNLTDPIEEKNIKFSQIKVVGGM
jgi:hypothetical protein